MARIERPRRICDVGCGSGSFAIAVAQVYGGTIACLTLIDPSPRMLTAATNALGPQCGDLMWQKTDLAGAARQLDMVLAALVQPRGHLLLIASQPHWCQWLIWPLWRHRWFTPDQVIGAATRAGLTHHLTHHFAKGPPSRTSLGHLFTPSPQT